jgi:hypothetical protein
MKLFKRNTDKGTLSDKAAGRIAKGILKTHGFFVNVMQSVTNNWKQKQQRLFLYSICIVFGSLSVVAIIQPFKTKQPGSSFKPQSIAVPRNINQKPLVFIITDTEFKKVQEYKQQHPDLMKERPGLYDSLRLIEENYYSQKK